jgi:hypothetical protein
MSFIIKVVNVGEYVLVRHEIEAIRKEFEEALSNVKRMLDEHRWKKLLIDMRGIESRLGVAEVYYSMESIAKELRYIKIGIVFPPEREEEGNFAENVAINRGVHLKSFVGYEQAVAWLTNEQA